MERGRVSCASWIVVTHRHFVGLVVAAGAGAGGDLHDVDFRERRSCPTPSLHNKVLHEVILLSIFKYIPEVPSSERLTVDPLQHGIYRVKASYGFMETPNVEDIRARLLEAGIKTKRMDTTYYLGREDLICANGVGMSRWRKKLFAVLHYTAQPAAGYFGIPPGRAVELGMQITI
jgi:KUP system potassium uptake protein